MAAHSSVAPRPLARTRHPGLLAALLVLLGIPVLALVARRRRPPAGWTLLRVPAPAGDADESELVPVGLGLS
jgi:hypothetical protein